MTTTDDNHSDHYPGLIGARLMPTDASRTTHDHLRMIVTHHGIGCFHGRPGLGKTLAVNIALRVLAPHSVIRLQIPSPTLPKVRDALLRRFNTEQEPPGSARAAERALYIHLTQAPHVLVFDEAQRLDGRTLDYLCTLWDDPETHITLVFVGAENCRDKIMARPALASRVTKWQHYQPLTKKEVLETIPHYHPLWQGIAPDIIGWLDTASAHGNFRNWARITLAIQDDRTHHPDQPLTTDYLRWILSTTFDGETTELPGWIDIPAPDPVTDNTDQPENDLPDAPPAA